MVLRGKNKKVTYFHNLKTKLITQMSKELLMFFPPKSYLGKDAKKC